MNTPFGKKPVGPPIKKMIVPVNRNSPAAQERMRVINYLQNVKVEGMRKTLCFSCSFVKLYDKNNKEYLVGRSATLEQVKNIVEEIRKINAE